jgi:AmmeMemoRadiSam system protein A
MKQGDVEGNRLTSEEKLTLLRLARGALECGVRHEPLAPISDTCLTPTLRAEGASFVTLTIQGNLRGCIGALEPYQPLVEDVREHTLAAALEDFRFPPVKESELARIVIEISRLTIPTPLDYSTDEDLLAKLHSGIDGVIIREGIHRATFLPQVWEKIPDPAEFLANLCYKMGESPDAWRQKHMDVSIYRVEEFHE